MTSLFGGARPLALPIALLLAAGTLVTTAAPAQAVRTTFTNSGGVAIADPIFAQHTTDITIADLTQATPYPSTINIAESGVIADVNVKFDNVDHGFPNDIDMLLVGPTGEQATIMSDAGGSTAMSDMDFTLDDQAATALPDEDVVVDGSFYRPANYAGADDFPAPAPADMGDSVLSAFDGTNAQGIWSLYVVDDGSGAVGVIDSWELDIEVKSGPYPSTIDVSGLGNKVFDVNVSLDDLSHTFAPDIDLLLVGPSGTYATIMSDVGSSTPAAGIDLVLDDEAMTSLPTAANLTSGTFQPTNNGATDLFPAPAPVASGAPALSNLDGGDPNGTWSLYVIDDANVDQGTLGSWSLDIETDDTPPTGTAKINGSKAVATSRDVSLDLTSSDPGSPTSGVEAVRFSNDGVTFSTPAVYADSKAWTLSKGDGTKKVWVKFVDASGLESAPVSDTIKLDTTGPRATKLKPGNHAEAVTTSARVRIVASEKLKKGTVNGTTVVLKAPSGKVAAKVAYTAATKTITIVPIGGLRHRTTYAVTVTRVRDVNGVKWDQTAKAGAQPLKFSFTTG